jgi:heptosyltransferase-2
MPVVLSGLEADERDLARAVAEQIGPVARVAPAAPSPQALGAFVRRCRVVIGNDGGVIHVASAVKTPVVAIFGPTNDRAWGPYPADDPGHAVVREVLACAPCIHRGHDFGTPEGCPARTCLAILEPSRVLQAAERLLSLQQAVA